MKDYILLSLAYLLVGLLFALYADKENSFGGICAEYAARYILFWPFFICKNSHLTWQFEKSDFK